MRLTDNVRRNFICGGICIIIISWNLNKDDLGIKNKPFNPMLYTFYRFGKIKKRPH